MVLVQAAQDLLHEAANRPALALLVSHGDSTCPEFEALLEGLQDRLTAAKLGPQATEAAMQCFVETLQQEDVLLPVMPLNEQLQAAITSLTGQLEPEGPERQQTAAEVDAVGSAVVSPQHTQQAASSRSTCADLLQQLLARCQQAADQLTAAGDLLGQARAGLCANRSSDYQADDEGSSLDKVVTGLDDALMCLAELQLQQEGTDSCAGTLNKAGKCIRRLQDSLTDPSSSSSGQTKLLVDAQSLWRVACAALHSDRTGVTAVHKGVSELLEIAGSDDCWNGGTVHEAMELLHQARIHLSALMQQQSHDAEVTCPLISNALEALSAHCTAHAGNTSSSTSPGKPGPASRPSSPRPSSRLGRMSAPVSPRDAGVLAAAAAVTPPAAQVPTGEHAASPVDMPAEASSKPDTTAPAAVADDAAAGAGPAQEAQADNRKPHEKPAGLSLSIDCTCPAQAQTDWQAQLQRVQAQLQGAGSAVSLDQLQAACQALLHLSQQLQQDRQLVQALSYNGSLDSSAKTSAWQSQSATPADGPQEALFGNNMPSRNIMRRWSNPVFSTSGPGQRDAWQLSSPVKDSMRSGKGVSEGGAGVASAAATPNEQHTYRDAENLLRVRSSKVLQLPAGPVSVSMEAMDPGEELEPHSTLQPPSEASRLPPCELQQLSIFVAKPSHRTQLASAQAAAAEVKASLALGAAVPEAASTAAAEGKADIRSALLPGAGFTAAGAACGPMVVQVHAVADGGSLALPAQTESMDALTRQKALAGPGSKRFKDVLRQSRLSQQQLQDDKPFSGALKQLLQALQHASCVLGPVALTALEDTSSSLESEELYAAVAAASGGAGDAANVHEVLRELTHHLLLLAQQQQGSTGQLPIRVMTVSAGGTAAVPDHDGRQLQHATSDAWTIAAVHTGARYTYDSHRSSRQTFDETLSPRFAHGSMDMEHMHPASDGGSCVQAVADGFRLPSLDLFEVRASAAAGGLLEGRVSTMIDLQHCSAATASQQQAIQGLGALPAVQEHPPRPSSAPGAVHVARSGLRYRSCDSTGYAAERIQLDSLALASPKGQVSCMPWRKAKKSPTKPLHDISGHTTEESALGQAGLLGRQVSDNTLQQQVLLVWSLRDQLAAAELKLQEQQAQQGLGVAPGLQASSRRPRAVTMDGVVAKPHGAALRRNTCDSAVLAVAASVARTGRTSPSVSSVQQALKNFLAITSKPGAVGQVVGSVNADGKICIEAAAGALPGTSGGGAGHSTSSAATDAPAAVRSSLQHTPALEGIAEPDAEAGAAACQEQLAAQGASADSTQTDDAAAELQEQLLQARQQLEAEQQEGTRLLQRLQSIQQHRLDAEALHAAAQRESEVTRLQKDAAEEHVLQLQQQMQQTQQQLAAAQAAQAALEAQILESKQAAAAAEVSEESEESAEAVDAPSAAEAELQQQLEAAREQLGQEHAAAAELQAELQAAQRLQRAAEVTIAHVQEQQLQTQQQLLLAQQHEQELEQQLASTLKHLEAAASTAEHAAQQLLQQEKQQQGSLAHEPETVQEAATVAHSTSVANSSLVAQSAAEMATCTSRTSDTEAHLQAQLAEAQQEQQQLQELLSAHQDLLTKLQEAAADALEANASEQAAASEQEHAECILLQQQLSAAQEQIARMQEQLADSQAQVQQQQKALQEASKQAAHAASTAQQQLQDAQAEVQRMTELLSLHEAMLLQLQDLQQVATSQLTIQAAAGNAQSCNSAQPVGASAQPAAVLAQDTTACAAPTGPTTVAGDSAQASHSDTPSGQPASAEQLEAKYNEQVIQQLAGEVGRLLKEQAAAEALRGQLAAASERNTALQAQVDSLSATLDEMRHVSRHAHDKDPEAGSALGEIKAQNQRPASAPAWSAHAAEPAEAAGGRPCQQELLQQLEQERAQLAGQHARQLVLQQQLQRASEETSAAAGQAAQLQAQLQAAQECNTELRAQLAAMAATVAELEAAAQPTEVYEWPASMHASTDAEQHPQHPAQQPAAAAVPGVDAAAQAELMHGLSEAFNKQAELQELLQQRDKQLEVLTAQLRSRDSTSAAGQTAQQAPSKAAAAALLASLQAAAAARAVKSEQSAASIQAHSDAREHTDLAHQVAALLASSRHVSAAAAGVHATPAGRDSSLAHEVAALLADSCQASSAAVVVCGASSTVGDSSLAREIAALLASSCTVSTAAAGATTAAEGSSIDAACAEQSTASQQSGWSSVRSTSEHHAGQPTVLRTEAAAAGSGRQDGVLHVTGQQARLGTWGSEEGRLTPNRRHSGSNTPLTEQQSNMEGTMPESDQDASVLLRSLSLRERELEQLQAQLADKETQLSQTSAQLSKLQAQHTAQEERVAELSLELYMLKAESAHRVSAAEAAVKTLQAELQTRPVPSAAAAALSAGGQRQAWQQQHPPSRLEVCTHPGAQGHSGGSAGNSPRGPASPGGCAEALELPPSQEPSQLPVVKSPTASATGAAAGAAQAEAATAAAPIAAGAGRAPVNAAAAAAIATHLLAKARKAAARSAAAEAQQEQLERELAALQAAAQSKQLELEQELVALQTAAESKQQEMEQELQAARAAGEALQQRMQQALAAERAAAGAAQQQLAQELEAERAAAAAQLLQHIQLTEELALQHELHEVQLKEAAVLKQRLATADEEAARLRARLQEKAQQLQQLQAQMQALQQQYQQLMQQHQQQAALAAHARRQKGGYAAEASPTPAVPAPTQPAALPAAASPAAARAVGKQYRPGGAPASAGEPSVLASPATQQGREKRAAGNATKPDSPALQTAFEAQPGPYKELDVAATSFAVGPTGARMGRAPSSAFANTASSSVSSPATGSGDRVAKRPQRAASPAAAAAAAGGRRVSWPGPAWQASLTGDLGGVGGQGDAAFQAAYRHAEEVRRLKRELTAKEHAITTLQATNKLHKQQLQQLAQSAAQAGLKVTPPHLLHIAGTPNSPGRNSCNQGAPTVGAGGQQCPKAAAAAAAAACERPVSPARSQRSPGKNTALAAEGAECVSPSAAYAASAEGPAAS